MIAPLLPKKKMQTTFRSRQRLLTFSTSRTSALLKWMSKASRWRCSKEQLNLWSSQSLPYGLKCGHAVTLFKILSKIKSTPIEAPTWKELSLTFQPSWCQRVTFSTLSVLKRMISCSFTKIICNFYFLCSFLNDLWLVVWFALCSSTLAIKMVRSHRYLYRSDNAPFYY